MDLLLPPGAAVRLFEHLSPTDRTALVRAYPVLTYPHATFRARKRPWQARLPVEIAQAALEYLSPADYYTACCVCAFWRSCGLNARMLKAQLHIAISNSCDSAADLADVLPLAEDATTQDLWLYFVVAAPRRYMFNNGMRRNRVVSLDLRSPLAAPAPNAGPGGVFLSDYGGVIALSSPTGLIFYSIEDMLPNSYDTPPSASDLGTLHHPRGVTHSQLVDVSIAHQQGTSGRFHVFALYDGGSVFRAGIELVTVPETHLKQAKFSRFSLVYGGPPFMSTVECDWSGVPPPSSFKAAHIDAVAPAAPARAMIALRAAGSGTATNANAQAQVYVALVRTDSTRSPSRSPERARKVRTRRSLAALDVLRLRSRRSLARSGATAAWDLLTLSYPEVASTDWRAQQSDRLAVQEVFLEWLHAPNRTPVLKSMDIGSGLHLTLEGLTPLTARLTPKGLNLRYATGTRLPSPPGFAGVAPKMVCALQYVQRTLLIAALFASPSPSPSSTSNNPNSTSLKLYLYEGLPADILTGRTTPRLLTAFSSSASVQSMRFYGGFTSAPEEPPCSGKIVLAVVMRAGFVHLAQFTAHDLNAPVEWSVPADVKLRGAGTGMGMAGWKNEWVANADGSMLG